MACVAARETEVEVKMRPHNVFDAHRLIVFWIVRRGAGHDASPFRQLHAGVRSWKSSDVPRRQQQSRLTRVLNQISLGILHDFNYASPGIGLLSPPPRNVPSIEIEMQPALQSGRQKCSHTSPHHHAPRADWGKCLNAAPRIVLAIKWCCSRVDTAIAALVRPRSTITHQSAPETRSSSVIDH